MVRQGLDGFAETTWNGNQIVKAGEELDVFFGLSGVNESVAVYAQDISVHYNPNDVELVSANAQKDGFIIADKVLTEGKARFITVYTGKSPRLSGNLLKLTFKAKSDAAENTVITLNSVVQSNGQGIESRLSGAALHVQIEESTGNPNPLPGDVNNDGRLSIGDLALVASAYGKTSADTDWALYKKYDLVQDNIIDISDLVFMARSILDSTSQ
ncbi:cohesin domain-containing protein [Paenibacillus sp. FSL H8-0548]|uniref:cohesin domain-containing protein n=1 Tax=Paenibacillus sp. FSL H8-0548 TaxID=1920422 RepID=UPI00315A0A9A